MHLVASHIVASLNQPRLLVASQDHSSTRTKRPMHSRRPGRSDLKLHSNPLYDFTLSFRLGYSYDMLCCRLRHCPYSLQCVQLPVKALLASGLVGSLHIGEVGSEFASSRNPCLVSDSQHTLQSPTHLHKSSHQPHRRKCFALDSGRTTWRSC